MGPNLPPSSVKTYHLYYIGAWFTLLVSCMDELLRSFLAIKFCNVSDLEGFKQIKKRRDFSVT